MNNLAWSYANLNLLFEEQSLSERIDESFGGIVGKMAEFLFYPVANIPVIIWVLMLGAIFFTFYHKWINLKGFKHS